MKNMRRIVVAAVAVPLIFGVVGCTSTPSAEQESSRTTPSPQPTPTTSPTSTELVDPSAEDSYCDVISGLVALAQQSSSSAEPQEVLDLFPSKLDILRKSASKLSTLTQDAESDQWQELSNSYEETLNFYVSIGKQIANDDFLLKLAESVSISDQIFTEYREQISQKCNINTSVLVTE